MGSGDPSGLQNRRELASLALVSSTLTRFRQFSIFRGFEAKPGSWRDYDAIQVRQSFTSFIGPRAIEPRVCPLRLPPHIKKAMASNCKGPPARAPGQLSFWGTTSIQEQQFCCVPLLRKQRKKSQEA